MNKSIVIVEDEALIARQIASILEDLGFLKLKIFHNSDKAIEYLSFNIPDLLICDIAIKGSMDGIELSKKIQKRNRLPIIYLTSYSDAETLSRAKRTMPYGYILKPFDERDLLSSIEMALHRFSTELSQAVLDKQKIEESFKCHFTKSEYIIIDMIIKGEAYSEIYKSLNISKNTLKFHTKNIYSKTDSMNKADFLQKLLNIVMTK